MDHETMRYPTPSEDAVEAAALINSDKAAGGPLWPSQSSTPEVSFAPFLSSAGCLRCDPQEGRRGMEAPRAPDAPKGLGAPAKGSQLRHPFASHVPDPRSPFLLLEGKRGNAGLAKGRHTDTHTHTHTLWCTISPSSLEASEWAAFPSQRPSRWDGVRVSHPHGRLGLHEGFLGAGGGFQTFSGALSGGSWRRNHSARTKRPQLSTGAFGAGGQISRERKLEKVRKPYQEGKRRRKKGTTMGRCFCRMVWLSPSRPIASPPSSPLPQNPPAFPHLRPPRCCRFQSALPGL
ncbi:hypothetical protein E2320_013244 [Naja naja]|nr:hypothetical protein E2320_013244 [Naja naja]